MVEEAVRRWAGERGYRVGWGSLEIIESAREELLERRRTGELAEGLVQEELTSVSSWEVPDWATSVIVVVVASTANRVSFDLGGRVLDTILPPTYLRYSGTFEEVRHDLQQCGLPGRRVEQLTAPLKAVAARMGLVRYGRNNLTYSDEFGSYLQLCGYVTDERLNGTDARAVRPVLLDDCEDCDACHRACPTGAIGRDRVLVRAERCLSFANERPGGWPEWVPARAHHCLMGCLDCQWGCPANPRLTVANSGISFSFDETLVLLGGEPSGDPPSDDRIRHKLIELGHPWAESALARNLRALIDRRAQRS